MSYSYPTKLTASGLVSDVQGKLDSLIDVFDLAGEPTNGHILSYNSTDKHFDAIPNPGGIALTDISVTDSGGDGSLSYNNSTGVITYTGPSASEVRAHISVTDSGGDGSMAYNSSTGVITYTGPSASEVQAHITPGEGIDISSGVVSGEDATVSNKGIASFNTNHFSVSSGAVSLSTGINSLSDVDTTGVANNKILKYNSSNSRFEIADESGGGIALTDLSVSTGSTSHNGGLSYNNSTGVFTHHPVAPTWLDHGVVAISGTITLNYATATVHRVGVTAQSSGSIALATPTNMEQGAEMTVIFNGVGTVGQDADITLSNFSNLIIDTGAMSGFSVDYGRWQIWKIIYDGTNYFMYKASNGDLDDIV